LETLGLGEYKLGDISHMSRKEMNEKIEAAYSGVLGMQKEGKTQPPFDIDVVARMVQDVKRTLVDLDWNCSDFTLVDDVAKMPSACIMTYKSTAYEVESEKKQAAKRKK
jgi:hypothetical protein